MIYLDFNCLTTCLISLWYVFSTRIFFCVSLSVQTHTSRWRKENRQQDIWYKINKKKTSSLLSRCFMLSAQEGIYFFIIRRIATLFTFFCLFLVSISFRDFLGKYLFSAFFSVYLFYCLCLHETCFRYQNLCILRKKKTPQK